LSAAEFDPIEKVDPIEKFDPAPASDWMIRRRAYQAVRELLSDDNNYDRGLVRARAVVDLVSAQAGDTGLTKLAMVLTMNLAQALERIAAGQQLAASDLAEVWFVD